MDPQALSQRPHGTIYLADTPLLDISATDIRRRRHNGESCDDLLPNLSSDILSYKVYIAAEGFYHHGKSVVYSAAKF